MEMAELSVLQFKRRDQGRVFYTQHKQQEFHISVTKCFGSLSVGLMLLFCGYFLKIKQVAMQLWTYQCLSKRILETLHQEFVIGSRFNGLNLIL
jgi:hypothetical protein